MKLLFCIILILLLNISFCSSQGIDVKDIRKKYFRQWRKDSNGCKGIRVNLLDKLFSYRINDDKRYVGLSKNDIIILFGKSEKNLSPSSGDLTYHLACNKKIWCLVFTFKDNRVRYYGMDME